MWRCCSRWSRRGHFNCEFFHMTSQHSIFCIIFRYLHISTSQSLNATDDLWAQLNWGLNTIIASLCLGNTKNYQSVKTSLGPWRLQRTRARQEPRFSPNVDAMLLLRMTYYIMYHWPDEWYEWYEATSSWYDAMRQWHISDLGNVEWLGGLTWVCPSPSRIPLQRSELICIKDPWFFWSQALRVAELGFKQFEPSETYSKCLSYVTVCSLDATRIFDAINDFGCPCPKSVWISFGRNSYKTCSRSWSFRPHN